ncbi:MAG: sigma-70 family RNA polymerase sigma factor [Clostridia bacterium]|nr:sigma-70 family RNA polymerase sigma factor [Clostridia bacterium]
MQYEEMSEHELFECYDNQPSDALKECILRKYLYIAEIVAKKFVGRGVEFDDLFQVASLALVKAVDRFENVRGVKFSSFATPTLVGEIKNYFRDKTRIIRISRRDNEMIRKMDDAKEVLQRKKGRNIKPEDIARYLGIDVERVLELMETQSVGYATSLDSAIAAGEDVQLMQILGSEDSEYEKVENRDFIAYCMARLNDVEKQLIKYRYVYEKSQREVAAKLGVSQMYVSRVERKILEKLRTIYENQV